MTTNLIPLRPEAERYLEVMHLALPDEAFVRNSVYWYGNENTCEVLWWLIYVIKNTIKACFPSIFGKSDWQLSLEMIENRALEFARGGGENENGVRLYDRCPDTNPERNAQLNAIVRNAARQIAEELLQHCYSARLGEESMEAILPLLPNLDLTRFSDQLAQRNLQLLF